jgi:hypothetical protein
MPLEQAIASVPADRPRNQVPKWPSAQPNAKWPGLLRAALDPPSSQFSFASFASHVLRTSLSFMAKTKCGFDSQQGIEGSILLSSWGPTLLVDIGFDQDYKPDQKPLGTPKAAITGIEALVDTGASESCIDSLLASQLNLPIADKRPMGGIGGQQMADMYLAQIHVPSLNFTIYGMFAGVHLAAGGQRHKVLIGRTFLQSFTMVYEGKTGTVTISSD